MSRDAALPRMVERKRHNALATMQDAAVEMAREPALQPSTADVMIQALLDATGQKDKLEAMKKRLGDGYTQHADPYRDDYSPSDAVRKLRTKPLRVDLEFVDPIKARRELSIIAAALVKALAISQDHERGAYNQLADMRYTLRQATQEVQALRGKKSRPD